MDPLIRVAWLVDIVLACVGGKKWGDEVREFHVSSLFFRPKLEHFGECLLSLCFLACFAVLLFSLVLSLRFVFPIAGFHSFLFFSFFSMEQADYRTTPCPTRISNV
jgi:hypothetical protein